MSLVMRGQVAERGVALQHRLAAVGELLHLEPVVHQRERCAADVLGRLGRVPQGGGQRLGATGQGEVGEMDSEFHGLTLWRVKVSRPGRTSRWVWCAPAGWTTPPVARSSPSAPAAVTVCSLASTRPAVAFASSVRRAASFTGSPMTVYSKRCSAPMLPATTRPDETPMPASSPGCRPTEFVERDSQCPGRPGGTERRDRAGRPAHRRRRGRRRPSNLLIHPPAAVVSCTTAANTSLSKVNTSARRLGDRHGGGADHVDEQHADLSLFTLRGRSPGPSPGGPRRSRRDVRRGPPVRPAPAVRPPCR